ncbi:MAG: sigma-70 region 4 domain-containing protein [Bacteroidetes bacterium]|nr:sigma-70 region 4 domain-containing protein [Bacteroidota bacterium]
MGKKSVAAVVITGDVVSSTGLSISRKKKLRTLIENLCDNVQKQFPDFQWQQYRGDSLQGILTKNKMWALSIALQLQCLLISHEYHIRLALGIGDISFQGKDIITSDGTAFRQSGPMVDQLKQNGRLIGISAEAMLFNEEWQVHNESLNFLLQRLSEAQAQALYLYLQNIKQEDIAVRLKISQPSVHQRLQAAGTPVFMSILKRFEKTLVVI